MHAMTRRRPIAAGVLRRDFSAQLSNLPGADFRYSREVRASTLMTAVKSGVIMLNGEEAAC